MRGQLSISLKAIQDNYKILQQKTSAQCAAVVKADAYGLGVEPVAQALAQVGATDFFVALPEEGEELREILPDANIYVLHGVLANEIKFFEEHNLIPVLNDKGQAALWNNRKPCALHVDTGLNRLGFNPGNFYGFDDLNIQLVMSHLACADTPQNPMNTLQLQRFTEATQQFPDIKKSLAASDGIFCGTDFHFDMVRPGAALYGINPTPAQANPMHNVVQLTIPVLQTRDVEQDGTVGYATTQAVKKGQRLATVSLGYADGFFRSLSNQGTLYFKGRELPILGRVSMDVVTVDITNAPEIRAGDSLEVLGPNQSIDELGKAAGSIGYEFMTALGRRFSCGYTG